MNGILMRLSQSFNENCEPVNSVNGNYSLECRVRENRTHGSGRGELKSFSPPYPYHCTCVRAESILRAGMSETIGGRHASACRYKNEIPEG